MAVVFSFSPEKGPVVGVPVAWGGGKHLKASRTHLDIADSLGEFGAVWDSLGHFGTVWDSLGQFGIWVCLFVYRKFFFFF